MAARRLSIADAACVLYRTDSPSDEQIGRVFERMKAGAIEVVDRDCAPRDWLTTEQSLADFVAATMVRRQTPKRGTQPSVAATLATQRPAVAGRGRDAGQLATMYHSIWRDAFLAVLLRKRLAHRSHAFHRAALCAQIVLLLMLVGTVFGAVRWTVAPVVPEHRAIEAWIDAETDTHSVVRWHPPQAAEGGGTLIEVEYRYTKDTTRVITTRRTFQVRGDTVQEVQLE